MNHLPPMLFVAGNSRSGTTMMGRILSGHDDIFTFHELHFFEQLWSTRDAMELLSDDDSAVLYAKLLRNQRSGYISKANFTSFLPEALADLKEAARPLMRHDVFQLFLQNEARKNGKSIACEQTPRNILYLEEILSLYPHAKVILMVRDPRDVLLSQKRKWKRKFLGATNLPLRESIRSWVNYHSITISKLWNVNFKILQRYRKHPAVLILRFEDLVTDPVLKIQEVCDFLNIRYSPAMLKVPVAGSSNANDAGKVGINASTVGQWNKGGLSSGEIAYCQRICQAGMEQLRYKPLPVRTGFIPLAIEAVTFPFKLLMAFGLNLNRMKNIRESLSRRLQTKQPSTT